jgi:gamma-glutamylcyclotransferase (GGCT)/AIG2-like uncharacterized protein YtfP
VNYFAYGSNMSFRRLQQRVPQVQRVDTAVLAGYRLCFHKIGQDGSAKCDAFFTGAADDLLHGVLYHIEQEEKQVLDRIEGLGAGYEEQEVSLQAGSLGGVSALTYVATHIDASLQPFGWYKQHVLVGAREAGLPASYIDAIAAHPCRDDHDRRRHQRESAIHL